MIQLLMIPFVIGVAAGIEPPPRAMTMAPDAPAEATASATAEAANPVEPVAREPEPQVPTGQFTTAVEVKPILGMTKGNWVAVREFNGNDLVYFTHLLAWRCGLWEIRYSLNGSDALETYAMEPCHEGTNQPNAMTDVANYLPYVTLPLASVDSIYVELVFDDGTTDFAVFERQAVLMP